MVTKLTSRNHPSRPAALRSGHWLWAVGLTLNIGLWLAALCLPASPVDAEKQRAWQLIERSLQAEGTVAYEGLREIVIFQNGQKVAGYQQKVQHATQNRERVVVLHPPQQRGRLEICDGHRRWEHYPAAKRVIISSVPPLSKLHQSRLASLRAAQRHLAAEYLGDGSIAGRAVHIVRVTDSQRRPLRQLWIDQQTFVQLKIHRFAPNGQIIYSAYFTTIKYNPTFDPGLFTFEPPADCHVSTVPPPLRRVPLKAAEKQAGFRAILPRYIPRGYQLERNSVAVSRHDHHFMLWLPFSNGLDTFSLFQAPRSLQPPKACRAGHSWTQGKYCFALIGPLSPDEIQKIKASMGR